ncbi:MAG: flavodoxin family protein [Nanoarchaeota archaeon]|nr:flavodoxin family protein [Nanoarchaeota archaeon]
MKINIIYFTRTNNTLKIAEAITSVLKLKHEVNLIPVNKATDKDFIDADMIGFASGINAFDFEKPIKEFVTKLKSSDKKVFIISTSASGKTSYHSKFKKILTNKSFNLVGEFTCKGFTKWGPFKLIGGIAKDRPNEEDFDKAKEFAKSIF